MRKLLVLMLALMMVLTLFVACTPAEDPQQGGNESESKAPTASESKPTGGEESKPADSSSEEEIGEFDPSINLGGDENTNKGIIFYPIGYWNSEETYVKNALKNISSKATITQRSQRRTYDFG